MKTLVIIILIALLAGCREILTEVHSSTVPPYSARIIGTSCMQDTTYAFIIVDKTHGIVEYGESFPIGAVQDVIVLDYVVLPPGRHIFTIRAVVPGRPDEFALVEVQ